MHGSYGFCNRKICSYRDDFMRHWIPTGHTSSQDVYEAPRYPQAARYNQQRSRQAQEINRFTTCFGRGLRNKKKVVLDAYGTILFADIVSFTVFSTNLPPIKLVQILNDMFAMHDELAIRVGVDKVKTLGDCYVACSGVLSPLANHAASMVQFGIGMHWVMERLNKRHNLNGKGPFGKDLRIRVGCSSGSIVGGVVGGKKFIFDIWGEKVEDAEIMESGGVPERTHVSQTTYIRAVKDSTLKFEKLDRLPEEGYPKEKGQTYLAIVPNDVEAWLNGCVAMLMC